MHSSRMRTGHSLTVCRSQLPGGCLLRGGVSAPRGVCSRGVSAPGGSALGVCSGGGCIPGCTEAETPLWTESQTPVKTLPWPNFVAAGNKPRSGSTASPIQRLRCVLSRDTQVSLIRVVWRSLDSRC